MRAPNKSPSRPAVLISGRGSNLDAIMRRRAEIPGEFVGVISSRPDVAGLRVAERHGLPTAVVVPAKAESRSDYDARLRETLDAWECDLLILAGFMRILSEGFVRAWTGRIVNIHPSLLPSFPGLHPQRQALEQGVAITGCTVHFVEVGPLDGGAIIAQGAVPVRHGDDVVALSRRIQRVEHALYPAVVAALCSGEIWLRDDGDVVGRASIEPIWGPALAR